MDRHKQKALEAAGFRVGDAADFLGLTDEERAIVELRVAVARAVRRLRERQHLSQQELATRIRSSQSRVAKIEAAAKGVSLDLSFRGLFAVGGTVRDLSAQESDSKSAPRARQGSRAKDAGTRRTRASKSKRLQAS